MLQRHMPHSLLSNNVLWGLFWMCLSSICLWMLGTTLICVAVFGREMSVLWLEGIVIGVLLSIVT